MMSPDSFYSHSLKRMGFLKTPFWLMPQKMYLDVNVIVPKIPASLLLDPHNWHIT